MVKEGRMPTPTRYVCGTIAAVMLTTWRSAGCPGRVGQPEDAVGLARIMAADTSIDCRVAAIEGIGALKPTDPRMSAALVEGMEHQDPAIRLASLQALRSITGKELGTEPEPWKKL